MATMDGIEAAIASSKYRRRIEAVLALHDLSHLFDYIVGGEDVPEGEGVPWSAKQAWA